MGQVVKYGQVAGPIVDVELPIAASEVFNHLSGNFVYIDSNNRIALCPAGTTNIIGWAFTGDFTASSTAGQTKVPVNVAKGAIYEIRLDAVQTEAALKGMVGETCDLIIVSEIQYADLDASTDDVLEIMGYRYYGSALGEQTVLVRLYEPNITAKGGVV